jgi:hypothetical protein
MSTRIFTISEGSDLVAAARDLAGQGGKADPARAWIRANGLLSAVELRRSGHEAQTLDGDLLLVSLEGPALGPLVGLVSVSDALGTRLVAGEVIAALVAATTTMCILHESAESEVATGSLEQVLERAMDPAPQSPSQAPATQSSPGLPHAAPSSPAEAPRERECELPSARSSAPTLFLSQTMPTRSMKPVVAEVETLVPDAGDRCEHFAFGTCEVVKSDGDRLHLRLGKDGRIKEIALEMLKVTELPDDGAPGRRFKLERRL